MSSTTKSAISRELDGSIRLLKYRDYVHLLSDNGFHFFVLADDFVLGRAPNAWLWVVHEPTGNKEEYAWSKDHGLFSWVGGKVGVWPSQKKLVDRLLRHLPDWFLAEALPGVKRRAGTKGAQAVAP